jgi:hypothetical protein
MAHCTNHAAEPERAFAFATVAAALGMTLTPTNFSLFNPIVRAARGGSHHTDSFDTEKAAWRGVIGFSTHARRRRLRLSISAYTHCARLDGT